MAQAEAGDLKAEVVLNSSDELGMIAGSYNRMLRQIREATTERIPEARSDDFVDLFTSQYSRLVGVLRISGAHGTAAEDLAQEAFARTLGHWRRVRQGSNPAGYVYRVAFRLLKRRVVPSRPPRVEYRLTPQGGRLGTVLDALWPLLGRRGRSFCDKATSTLVTRA